MSTVLLVEDSRTDAETLSAHLRQRGYTVIISINTDEARKQMQVQTPDLVILDVILPGKSGFEFCRELKNDPATKAIPVIISSTKGSDADKLWGTMLGADAYIPKPVDAADLIQKVQQLVR